MLTRDFDSIAWYFLEQSLPLGGGSNVVNVILVDFRGFDTLGEITVLGIAGVGVLALLDGLRLRRPELDPLGRPWSYAGRPLLLRRAARLVLPMALLVGGLHLPARPQPAGRRLHRRAGGGGGTGAAVHGARPAARRPVAACAGRPPLRALGRHRTGHRLADRRRRIVLRPALPDQRLRPSAAAAAGRSAAGHGRALRPGRVRRRRRCDDADAVDAGRRQPAAARPAEGRS